jgi:hypothetical protein
MRLLSLLTLSCLMASGMAADTRNLALGKKVYYSIMPDNPPDTTPSKLTDGKKNTRTLPVTGESTAATSFDEQKDNYSDTMDNSLTAGWHFKFYGRENFGMNMCIDLGQTEKLGKSILRAGSFTKSMYRFSLPREFRISVSEDGQNFYHAGTAKKVTTAGTESIGANEQSIKLHEDRNRWIEIEFDLSGISARYVGLTVKPEGFMFYLDEWEIFSGESDALNAKTYAPANRERFAVGNGLAARDAVVFQPTTEAFYVPENLFVPTFFDFGDYRTEKTKEPCRFVIDLPPGVTLHESYLLRNQFNIEKDNNRYTLTPRHTGKHFKRYYGRMLSDYSFGPLYFRTDGKVAADAEATFFCRIGDTDFTPAVCPVKTLAFPVADNKLPPFCAITWMIDYYAADWPDFLQSYAALGFNAVPYFPRNWGGMADLPETPFQPAEHLAKSRAAGMRIIQNESPLHTMKNLGKANCTYEGAKGFCPSYRGEYYQQHLQELAENSKIIQPDYLIWDIELMHRSFGGKPENILKCERCAAAVKASGKTPQEYLFDCGAEIQKDLYNAAAGVINGKFQAGQYDVYAGQKHYQSIWRFDRAYPGHVQLSMPAAYSAGLFDVNHRIAQREYRLLGEKWRSTPWVTPGTYGYCSPHKMEALVYEQILNGGNLCIYSFNEFNSPLQLYYMGKGLSNLCGFRELLERGKPDVDFQVDNAKLACSRFADGDKALVFIANYSSPDEEPFTLDLPKGAVRVDRDGQLPPGKHQLKLGPAEFALYHIN